MSEEETAGLQEKEAETAFSELVKVIREKLVIFLITGLPTLLIDQIINWITEETTSQPWQAFWYLLPITLIASILWQQFRHAEQAKKKAKLWLFFSVYVLFFSIAAGTNFLDFRRDLIGYTDTTPRNWLALNQLGDWRYSIANRQPLRPRDLQVVLIEPKDDENIVSRRLKLLKLIKLAKEQDARGVALDYFFIQETAIDRLLCDTIKTAGFPVVVGYSFKHIAGEPVPTTSAIECQTENFHQGHLLGYQEADKQVRSIPLYFLGQTDQPSLSLQIARVLAGYDAKKEPEFPELLYLLPPAEPIPQINLSEMIEDKEVQKLLKGRFVLFGENSSADRFDTPFGEIAGVMMHAYAAESLRHGHYVQRQSDLSSFFMVFAVCFLLASLAASAASVKKLLLLTVIISLAVVTLAAASMFLWQIWIAVSYPLIALWGLLPLMIISRPSNNDQ